MVCIINDSGKNVNSLVSDRIGHCEKKCHTNARLILNGHRNRTVKISRLEEARFLFVGLDKDRSLRKMCGHTRRRARSHFRCCYWPKEK